MNYEELSKALGLDFWLKAIGIFASASFFVGYILLNCYYAVWWGFTDDSLSKSICAAVMIWLVCVLIQAYVLDLTLGRIIAWIERSKHKRQVAGALILLYALFLLLVYCPYVQGLAKQHQIHLPSWYVLAIFAVVLHVALFFSLALPIAWLKSLRKEQPLLQNVPAFRTEKNKNPWSRIGGFVAMVPMLLLVFYVFSVTFMLIPARYGGGRPDAEELWVPRSAQSIFAGLHCGIAPDNQSGNQIGTGGLADEYLHYGKLYLIHEGSDSLIVAADNCSQILQVPKEFVKGRQWQWQRLAEAKSHSQSPDRPVKAQP